MSKILLCLLALLTLTGCGESARAWNPGCVPLITVSSADGVMRDRAARAPVPPGKIVLAWNDKDRREIRLPDGVPRNRLVAYALHEFGHEIEDEYPDVWMHLNAMAHPLFPCGEDGATTGVPDYRRAWLGIPEP